jgi:hypothetical protein
VLGPEPHVMSWFMTLRHTPWYAPEHPVQPLMPFRVALGPLWYKVRLHTLTILFEQFPNQ